MVECVFFKSNVLDRLTSIYALDTLDLHEGGVSSLSVVARPTDIVEQMNGM